MNLLLWVVSLKNVRLIVTARTGRLDQLQLPADFLKRELGGFTQEETNANVFRVWKNCSPLWLADFHHLSGGNPRVQGYAIDYGGGDQDRCLDYLRPVGKLLSDIFEARLKEAALKSGAPKNIEIFCGAVAVLPRPIPWKDLSSLSGLSNAQVRDICADLGEAIRVSADSIGFKIEDFEDFIVKRVGDELPAFQNKAADYLLSCYRHEEYAATHVANALYAAGRGEEIVALLEAESEPQSITDPLLRQQVKLKRLQIGMQVAAAHRNTTEAIRAILIGAEALKTHDAITELVVANPDLAVEFMRESAEQLILQDPDRIEHHGAFLFQLMLVEARNGNKVMARDYERRLYAWFQRRKEDREEKEKRNPKHPDPPWTITAQDIAAEVEFGSP